MDLRETDAAQSGSDDPSPAPAIEELAAEWLDAECRAEIESSNIALMEEAVRLGEAYDAAIRANPLSAAYHARHDAYAHNPYPLRPGETPSAHGCRFCPNITMATLPKLPILVRRYWGLKPVWLTEYGYQTNPPDQFLGVSPRQQATLLSLAAMRAWRLARVTMLIQYLYQDEPQLSRFQTGLTYVDGRPKPSLNGFRLPFAEMKRSGFETVVWGQLRDGKPGRKQYEIQVLRKNRWTPVAGVRLTNDNGAFVRTIRLKRGSLLRVWSPRQRLYSLRLRIR